MSLDGPPPTSKKPKKMKATKYPCAFCGDQHWSGECRAVLTFAERSTLLKQQNRCLRCLCLNHLTARCPATKPCHFCRGATHNAVLCTNAFGSKKRARKTIRAMRKVTAVKLNVPSDPALNPVVHESQYHDTPSTSSDSNLGNGLSEGSIAATSTASTTMTSRCNNWKKWKPDMTLDTAIATQVAELEATGNDICRLDTVEDSTVSAEEDPSAAGSSVQRSFHACAADRHSTATAGTNKLPHSRKDLIADIGMLNEIRDRIEADKKEIHRRQQSLRDREKNLANRESQLKERERKLTLKDASVLLMKVQLVELETKLQADRTSVDAAMEDMASERIEME
ncbi:Zinc knuckle family protein, partial [Aphelenchoides avenae]